MSERGLQMGIYNRYFANRYVEVNGLVCQVGAALIQVPMPIKRELKWASDYR